MSQFGVDYLRELSHGKINPDSLPVLFEDSGLSRYAILSSTIGDSADIELQSFNSYLVLAEEALGGYIVIGQTQELIRGFTWDGPIGWHEATAKLVKRTGERRLMWSLAIDADCAHVEVRGEGTLYITTKTGCCTAPDYSRAYRILDGQFITEYTGNLAMVPSNSTGQKCRFVGGLVPYLSREDQYLKDNSVLVIVQYFSTDSLIHRIVISSSEDSIRRDCSNAEAANEIDVIRADSALRLIESVPDSILCTAAIDDSRDRTTAFCIVANLYGLSRRWTFVIPITDDDLRLVRTSFPGFQIQKSEL